jgi:hypothetical protein
MVGHGARAMGEFSISACIPFLERLLEIAAGHGRWTQFLRDHCTSLIGVELAAYCVRRGPRRGFNQGAVRHSHQFHWG